MRDKTNFSREPETAIRAYCRRLRHRWPEVKIVLALWNPPEALLEAQAIKDLGADEVVISVAEALHRLRRMVEPEAALEEQIAPAPENDEERVAALHASQVLNGGARDDLDALARRAADVFNVKYAVISAIDEDTEYIIGQNADLPGARPREGDASVAMTRDEAICDHVVGSGETLIVSDIRRDPRFSDHPAVLLWKIRSYAGAPVRDSAGRVFGAFCLLDTEPREMSDDEIALLETMAGDTINLITGEDSPPAAAATNTGPSITVGQAVPD